MSSDMQSPIRLPEHPCALSTSQIFEALACSPYGLSEQEIRTRLEIFGKNSLPKTALISVPEIFIRQFLNPLIYILLIASFVSLAAGRLSDAVFIFIVLMINAIIGAIQEYSAQRSASFLQQLITRLAHVEREGEGYEIEAVNLVPGDIVLLETGDKVPADLRLINVEDLQIDESLLTGESLYVTKDARIIIEEKSSLGDRVNMAFSGTLVTRGRGMGVVTATGLDTQLGQIAEAVLTRERVKPPLLVRMERFTFNIAILMSVIIVILAAVTLAQGTSLTEVLLMATALAVAAIPEGLPVAITVALAISMRRMARRHVIVRRLVTVEALGSCTFIAADKTGTLTINEITAEKIIFADPLGIDITDEVQIRSPHIQILLKQISQVAALANEGFLGKRNGTWTHYGDPVDVALLVFAHKLGVIRPEEISRHPEIARIPFEPSAQFSASLNAMDGEQQVFVKGAAEKVLTMCSTMVGQRGQLPIDMHALETQADLLAAEGHRVLAMASGIIERNSDEPFTAASLKGLTFIGLIGMIDPLRKEAKSAVAACRTAGIEVAMVTGDHPATAFSIARQLGLATDPGQVVTGPMMKDAQEIGTASVDELTRRGRVFARMEPQQKLDIVQSLQRDGHFVAVTGDGANDAPALRAAHVGVAMGKVGTDVARETADMIITDDNFTSIVAGVEEGRIAYANVRKVISLLLSTGGGEIVLFTLALLMGLPLPLTAIQLLWLNLVTNGIQDIALVFEPGEGDELKRPPRAPGESIFNRLMIERVSMSAIVMGSISFANFQWMLSHGFTIDDARNITLLLMVLFENVHVFNSRSETLSAFTQNLFRNSFLLFGTIAAQLLHIGAMYTPGLKDVLDVHPVSLQSWFSLLLLALILLVAVEFHKAIKKWRPGNNAAFI